MRLNALAASAAPTLVISDVDGTLLDPGGWAAPPAELRRLLGSRPLILASSRTVRELVVLQRTLGLTGPVIAENGAVIALDAPALDGTTTPRTIGRRTVHVRRMGLRAELVRERLFAAARSAGVALRTADRLDAAHRARHGIVSHGAAERALDAREASVLLEPPVLSGSARTRWIEALAAHGVTVSTGGRWACAVSGADKGRAAQLVRALLAEAWHTPVETVGLGNDANDVPLLAVVDRPIVVRADDGRAHPALVAVPHAIVCARPGVSGAIETLRHQLATAPGVA